MTQPWNFPSLPYANSGYGYRTPWGQFLPPGGKVQAFVSSSTPSPFTGDEQMLNSGVPILTTLSAALAYCRAGKGDMIVCLPGHSESVVDNTMLANLVSGTRIMGIGNGSMMPTFRWTAAAAQWVLNDADVTIAGLRLRLEGFNGVTLAADVSAADVELTECDIETSSGAANLAAIAFRASVGATRFRLSNSRIRGLAAGTSTDIMLVNGAVDGLTLSGLRAMAPCTNGLFRTAAIATNMLIENCRYFNTVAGPGGVFGAQASVALVTDSYIGLSSDLAATTAFTQGAGATVRYFNTLFADTTNAYSFGIATGTTSA
jgi:hypothetical protein